MGKLLKYELRSTARHILPIFAAVLAISLIIRLNVSAYGFAASWITGLLILLETGLIIALVVMCSLIALQRFYTNLLGDEGYLMFTLPVSVHHHILSKLVVAVLWNVAASLVVVLSLLIMVSAGVSGDILQEIWLRIQNALAMVDLHPFLTIVGVFFSGLAAVTNSILGLYLAMALGQLANERRFLASLSAFLAMQIAGSVITTLCSLALRSLPTSWFQWFRDWMANPDIASFVNVAMLGTVSLSILSGFVYYYCTYWLLKNKLNMA